MTFERQSETAKLLEERAMFMRFGASGIFSYGLFCSFQDEAGKEIEIKNCIYDDHEGSEMFWNLVEHRMAELDARLKELGVFLKVSK